MKSDAMLDSGEHFAAWTPQKANSRARNVYRQGLSLTMLTAYSNEHPLMKRFQTAGDEKRSAVACYLMSCNTSRNCGC
jgi:hypothetical protein